MGRVPQRPEEIVESFVNDYRETFGLDVVSVILYGSGARGQYIPKHSDINFVIMLTELGMSNLGKAIPLIAKWRRRHVNTPLFLTEPYISSSLHVFPIEFINIKAAYQVVYGKDLLLTLSVDKNDVRLQCEREIKGKLLQLRESFLITGGHKRTIEALVADSLPTFFSLFQGILFIRDKSPVTDIQVLVTLMSREAGLDKELFRELAAIREGRKRLTSHQAVPLMERYIEQIRKLAGFIERMEI